MKFEVWISWPMMCVHCRGTWRGFLLRRSNSSWVTSTIGWQIWRSGADNWRSPSERVTIQPFFIYCAVYKSCNHKMHALHLIDWELSFSQVPESFIERFDFVGDRCKIDKFLSYRSQSLMWAFLIKICILSVVVIFVGWLLLLS